jgi:hypothetical protein
MGSGGRDGGAVGPVAAAMARICGVISTSTCLIGAIIMAGATAAAPWLAAAALLLPSM